MIYAAVGLGAAVVGGVAGYCYLAYRIGRSMDKYWGW